MLLALLVSTGLDSNHEPCPTPGEARAPALVARYIPTTGGLDTIAELPGLERTYGRESLYRESRYAYPKNAVFGIAYDRVYVGDTAGDAIFAMSFSGDTIAPLPVPFEPTPVPADGKATLFKEEEWSGGGERYTLRITYLYPDHYPRFARLVADPEERVWVMAYPPLKEPVGSWELELPGVFRRLEDGARWRVVDPVGLPVAELTTPPGFFLLEMGDDYVLGLSKDELERESVQLYRLIR